MREEKMVRQNKSDDKSNVKTRASLSFNARQNNSVLVNATALILLSQRRKKF